MNIIKEADAITDGMRIEFNNAVSVYFEAIEDEINNGGESNIETVVDTVTGVFSLIGNIILNKFGDTVQKDFIGTEFIDDLTLNYNNLFTNGLFDFISKYSYVSDSPRESNEDEVKFYKSIVRDVQKYGNDVLLPEFNLNLRRAFAMKLMIKFEKGL